MVYGRLTCDDHFELFGRAYGMTGETAREARRGLYAALGFERYAATRADQLSGGTLSKLNLGLPLLADPDVLLPAKAGRPDTSGRPHRPRPGEGGRRQ
ncbi:hypothetical protein [Streptomyces sp. S.PB5]|uniref:hypothetical protein n=1 Tax=Streptomyces sp. S.PB5 TaxID=3020844 RepID=UPI0025AFDD76|nr:hypothetical protein [Streptomyces sp. S.PB5]MDN3027118.1 hypothetical protein [Streptomyces sp. S.PB5]